MKVLVVAHESEFIGGANRALFAILKYWKIVRIFSLMFWFQIIRVILSKHLKK